jgi:UDP-2,3-diacylglucosamine hydrolase
LEAKKYYFFSDVHLGLKSKDIEKQKEKRVINFLESISSDAKEIFIVGDLFDCWIEYRKVVPKGYFNLLSALNKIVESGVEIKFLSGNHDFWLNTYLRDEVGLNICYNSLDLQLDGKRFFIAHGDGLAKGDRGYKILKKILRNRVNQFLYSLIHPDLGIKIAQGSSRKSRAYAKEVKNIMGEELTTYGVNKVKEGYDFVVMGHFHKPQKIEVNYDTKNGYFITLGDWIENNSYGVYINGNFDLKYWTINNTMEK